MATFKVKEPCYHEELNPHVCGLLVDWPNTNSLNDSNLRL